MRRSLIAFALLACTSGFMASDESSDRAAIARQSSEVLVRIETRAGAFMVRESYAQEFQGALAGELPERPLYAGR